MEIAFRKNYATLTHTERRVAFSQSRAEILKCLVINLCWINAVEMCADLRAQATSRQSDCGGKAGGTAEN
jgi:hypothetical protein